MIFRKYSRFPEKVQTAVRYFASLSLSIYLLSWITDSLIYPRFKAAVPDLNIQFWFMLPLGLLSLLTVGLARLCGAPARRRALRDAERTRRALRKQRASSRLPPPTPEQLVEAWEKSRTSLEWKILLGSLLSDLEPVVDRSYIRDEDGEIVGRNPGIRGWIFEHCPELRRHYKAMMSYKTLAARLRRVCGLFDPDSAEALLRVRPEGRGEAPQASAEARAQARALLDAAPSMRALDDALCERLGLPRMRRERRRTA